jgi:hypothetical protein
MPESLREEFVRLLADALVADVREHPDGLESSTGATAGDSAREPGKLAEIQADAAPRDRAHLPVAPALEHTDGLVVLAGLTSSAGAHGPRCRRPARDGQAATGPN